MALTPGLFHPQRQILFDETDCSESRMDRKMFWFVSFVWLKGQNL